MSDLAGMIDPSELEAQLDLRSGTVEPVLIGRSFLLSDQARIDFRNPEEAALVQLDQEKGALSIRWPKLSSYVRLAMPAWPLDAFLGRYERVTVEITLMAAAGSATPLRAEWLAFLRRDAAGGLALHQIIADKPTFGAETLLRWHIDVRDSAALTPGSVVLVLQFPSEAASFRLCRVGLKVIGSAGGGHDLRVEAGQLLTGQIADPQSDACLEVRARGAAALLLSKPVRGASFAVSFEPVGEALAFAEAPHAVLLVDGTMAAFVDLGAGAASPAALRRLTNLAAHPASRTAETVVEGVAGLKALFAAQEIEALWRLAAQARSGDPSHCPSDAFEAYLLYFFARSHIEVNAVATAAEALARLLSSPLALAFAPGDLRTARLLHARVCLRSGAAETGVSALRRLRLDYPMDWDCHVQLANAMRGSDARQRSLCLHAAAALHPKLPVAPHTALLMQMHEQGDGDGAMVRCLAALADEKASPELWLVLANLHLAEGDRDGWEAFLSRFFAAYGLTAPVFGAALGFAGLEAPPLAPETGYQDRTVTVAMTAYNAETTIEAAVRSVLRQTHRNLRLIVVDDASHDTTPELLERLAQTDMRLLVLRNSRNIGTYGSKNRVLAMAESDYIAFHDADDWMHPEHIARHLAEMELRAQTMCTTSSWIRMDASGQAVLLWGGGFLHENPASTFLRREVISRIGFFDTVRTGADSEFLWRMRRAFGRSSVLPLAIPLAIGLHHANSLTQSGVAAFDLNRHSAVRLQYWEAWVAWHRAAVLTGSSQLYMAHPLIERAFPAPSEVLP